MAQAATMALTVSDVSGQKSVRAPAVPANSTIGEVVQRLITKMRLALTDVDGAPLRYQATLDREGRHLHSGETVGDALKDEDEIVLSPDIEAG